jgi:hypothetical protein
LGKTYYIIKNYLLNGVYAYALFGVYAVTISPVITHFLDYRETNWFVAVFGFVMLIAEFIALNFKLKMVRIRTEEKRVNYKKETGIDVIPSVTPFVFLGFFMRLVFQVAIAMVIMTALGYDCNEHKMSPQGVIAILTVFLLEMGGAIYIYFNSDFYTDTPQNKKELSEDIKESEDWYKENIERASSVKYFRMEMASDIILQVYALMLFTSFWQYINEYGIRFLQDLIERNATAAYAGWSLFPLLIVTVMVALMPMRIAYWVEDSLNAFTKKERFVMWIVFFIVAVYSCSPVLIKFFSIVFFHFQDSNDSPPGFIKYMVSFSFFLILLLVELFLVEKTAQNKGIDNKN